MKIGVDAAMKPKRNAPVLLMAIPLRPIASPSRVGSGRDRGFNRGGSERKYKGETALCLIMDG
jgi:hypothetical protein